MNMFSSTLSSGNRKSAIRTSKLLGALPFAFVLVVALAQAQQPKHVPRVGFLVPGSASSYSERIEAFLQGLRELGHVEGQNIIIEYRYTEGSRDRLPVLAAELVQLKVDVIVTGTTPAIQAAKNATGTIPIVMAEVADPVAVGFVANLARPGGNITGFTTLSPDLDGKRLELLKDILPNVTRVAFIWDSSNSADKIRFKQVQRAAQALAITVQSLGVRNPKEMASALEAAIGERPGAVMVTNPSVLTYGKQIADFAAKNRLPLVFDAREHAEKVGGLMAYGPSFADLLRRAAAYVDKILKGAKPADLPVEQPTKFELVINLKNARQIGLTVPANVLARADRVIR